MRQQTAVAADLRDSLGKGGSEALVTADHAERRRRDGGQPTFWHRRAAPLAIGGDVA